MPKVMVALPLAAVPLLASCGSSPTAITNPPSAGAGRWQAAQILQPDVGTDAFPRVAFDAAGRGLAVWDAEGGLSFRQFEPATGWASLQQMRIDGPHRVQALAMNPLGKAFVTWLARTSANEGTVWANPFSPDSGPAQRLDDPNPGADFANFDLDAAIGPGGGAVVA